MTPAERVARLWLMRQWAGLVHLFAEDPMDVTRSAIAYVPMDAFESIESYTNTILLTHVPQDIAVVPLHYADFAVGFTVQQEYHANMQPTPMLFLSAIIGSCGNFTRGIAIEPQHFPALRAGTTFAQLMTPA